MLVRNSCQVISKSPEKGMRCRYQHRAHVDNPSVGRQRKIIRTVDPLRVGTNTAAQITVSNECSTTEATASDGSKAMPYRA